MLLGNSAWNIDGLKVNLDLLVLCELAAKRLKAARQSQYFKCRRMQAVGQVAHGIDQLIDALTQFLNPPANLRIFTRRLTRQPLKLDRNHRQVLAIIIVDFTRDPALFILLGFDQSSTERGYCLFRLLTIRDINSNTPNVA